jgi:AbrB family looped-hinge helix DNA binding protein
MASKVTLDKAGRVLIPKSIRQDLRLSPGDTLQLHREDDKITLRPDRPKALIRKERGVWVYQGEPASRSVVELIDQHRDRRLRDLSQ